ncbi:hypothetical protein MNBD_GAMMA12-1533 [hydrothermal vent metagenome]|uniref:Uncharacterized protein n=1 Tax=hydrothermal vent metagenome TaxID=652676 RepID=A0A3B0ZJ76_9ZZZZ
MNIKTILKWLFITPVVGLGILLLMVLPLLVLIKGTAMSYYAEMSYLLSLFIGGFAAFIVLLTYMIAIDRVAGRQIFFSIWVKLSVAALCVMSFVLYSMYVLNDENVKNRRIASQYTQTHPVLRLGLQSWSLFDRSLVITDIARSHSFYRRHRMRTYYRSLHFPQKHLDGKVYALDIRTKGRGKFRNWITQVVFRMMGFGTLRHTGTADHLHIELRLRKSDKQKIAFATRKIRNRNRANRKKRQNLLAEKRRVRQQLLRKLRTVKSQNERRLSEIEREKQNQGLEKSIVQKPVSQDSGMRNSATQKLDQQGENSSGVASIKTEGMRNTNSMTKSQTSNQSQSDSSKKITSNNVTSKADSKKEESELENDDADDAQ